MARAVSHSRGLPSICRMPPRQVRRGALASFRSVTLALQGGGALGAFTCGMRDRLLDEPRLHV